MKKFKFLFVLVLLCSFFVTSGCSPQEPTFKPWDDLGGGQSATDVTDYSDDVARDYLIDDVVDDESSSTGDYDASNSHEINLSTIATTDLSAVTDYSFKNNELKIKANGVYILSGDFSGCVTVSDTTGTVQLVLNGVNIATTNSQSCAAIVFKKPDGDTISERILTIKDGTTNTLSDSTGDDVTDGDGAVIQAKKRSLTVNGTGTLCLNCVGEETTGLKVKTALTINGPTIEVNGATKSGIKADRLLIVKNATIKISADGDGIKTDMEPDDETQAKEYASDLGYGYVYIENSDLDIMVGDDGISANNCVYVANTDENTIKITTNGGAPSRVTETTSDNADGKAIKTDGIEFNDVDYPATHSTNYGLVIIGGRFEINSNDDAVHSKGNVLICNGDLDIYTGDDGIHADYLAKITDGNVKINRCYEGVEGAVVEILGGRLDVTSTDDGINAANSDLRNFAFYILISGGDISIDAGGDGVDSNGTIKIIGGNLVVFGPTDGGNAALDADTGIIIDGGNVCAVGSVGMVENPSTNSSQCYVNLTLTATAAANTVITVRDSSGNVLLSVTPTKKYQSIILSLDGFVKGETYTVKVGDEEYSATLSETGTAIGRDMHGNGNQGLIKPGGGRK